MEVKLFIALCFTSLDLLLNIQKFKVFSNVFADHMPIALKLIINGNFHMKPLPLIPKLSWKEANKDSIEDKLKENIFLKYYLAEVSIGKHLGHYKVY